MEQNPESFAPRKDRVGVFEPKEQQMGSKDRASNKAQDAKGRVKEAAGTITGNRDLKSKGKADQAKAASKNRGEDLKDAVHKVKDAVTR